MSMSEARSAMPSSRMCAPSFTSAYMQRSTISSSEICARLRADLLPVLVDDLSTSGSGIGLRLPGSYRVQALAGLLAEAAQLADAVGDARVHEVRALLVAALADLPADVVARHVVHGERAHRHAPALQRAVHLLRRRALVEQEQALLAVLLEHAVADEAVAHARDHRHLLQPLAELHRGREHVLGGLLAAHHLEQTHHVRGARRNACRSRPARAS